ncbi:MAG: hypothetical protein E7515_06560 [Ruminococcaceae bacterium]|jgi:3-methyladenine DNA glycosylase Mpg|nr:hypothetical protein [Oscillospiraceae bacterium]
MTWKKIFELFGRRIRIKKNDESWQSENFYAFVSPLRYKNKMYLEDKRVPIGIGDMSYYLYLGPAEHDLTVLNEDEYMLFTDSESFFITRAERIYVSDSVSYIWAVLKRVKEEEQ